MRKSGVKGKRPKRKRNTRNYINSQFPFGLFLLKSFRVRVCVCVYESGCIPFYFDVVHIYIFVWVHDTHHIYNAMLQTDIQIKKYKYKRKAVFR